MTYMSYMDFLLLRVLSFQCVLKRDNSGITTVSTPLFHSGSPASLQQSEGVMDEERT
jgi:hypothetical protein